MQIKRPLTPKHRKSFFPDFIKEEVTSSNDDETTAFTGISTSGISRYTSLSKGFENEMRAYRLNTSKSLFKQPKIHLKAKKITLLMAQ